MINMISDVRFIVIINFARLYKLEIEIFKISRNLNKDKMSFYTFNVTKTQQKLP